MTETSVQLPVREAGWSPSKVEDSLVQLHRARESRVKRRRLIQGVSGALACAALVFLVVGQIPGKGAPLEEAATQPASALPASVPLVQEKERVDGQQTVRFRDGSTAKLLAKGSQLLVTEVSDKSVQVDLSEGGGQFEIVPNPTRRFVVLARGVKIAVLGTAFLVEHEPARVRVAVTRGKVRVSSRLGERDLTAGEAAWFPSDGAAAPDPALNPGEAEAPVVAPAPVESIRERFVEHHRRAEYKEAYAILSKAKSVVGSGDADLMRAADAARYSGHPAEAVDYLARVSKAGGHGTTAAFTRGRLFLFELGRPSDAAAAFAEARQLAPSGPLAEDALFREIEARKRAGQAAQARVLGQQFLKAYPTSHRRDAVARMTGTP